MNDSALSSATSAPAGYPAGKPFVSISSIDNGFILSWWTPKDGQHSFHAATLVDVSNKLAEIFA
jgi:hypothetical protein